MLRRATQADHVLLTRQPADPRRGGPHTRTGWLQDRVELFEHYCAPSVANQSQPVSWIVYFDPESPDWLMERLRPLVDRKLFRPIRRASVNQDELISDIRDTLSDHGDVCSLLPTWTMTTG